MPIEVGGNFMESPALMDSWPSFQECALAVRRAGVSCEARLYAAAARRASAATSATSLPSRAARTATLDSVADDNGTATVASITTRNGPVDARALYEVSIALAAGIPSAQQQQRPELAGLATRSSCGEGRVRA